MALAVAGFRAGADWPYAVNEIATAINEIVNVNLKRFSAFPIVRFYRGAVSMSHTHVHMRRSVQVRRCGKLAITLLTCVGNELVAGNGPNRLLEC